MAIFSLRGVISLLAATSIAIIAGVTLGITLTTALSALRSVGTLQAASLISNANAQTATLFSSATDALTSFDNVVRSDRWVYPSDDISSFKTFDAFIRTQTLQNLNTWTSFTTYFADNTRINYGSPLGTNLLYSNDNLIWSPYSTTFPNQTLVSSGKVFKYANNFSIIPSNDTLVAGQPTSTVLRVRDRTWPALLATTGGGLQPLITGVSASTSSTNVTAAYVVIAVPSYRYGDARVASNVFAVSIVAFKFSTISQFLAQLGGTANTVAFAYDGNGYMIGSSINGQVPYITIVAQTNLSYVPAGCSSTGQSAYNHGASQLLCRSHISQYAYAPLQSLATSSANFLLTSTTVTEWMSIGSDNYFVAAANVPLAYHGMTVNVALFIPETDIIGDVVAGRNMAIGITCGLFVVIAIVNFMLVSLLLSPLTRIAERMVDAANLEDDGTPDAPSAMSEVQGLQEAYFEMNAELMRIRSFVPQTVLAARRADRDLDLEQSGDDAAAHSTSDTRSVRSTRSRQSRIHAKSPHSSSAMAATSLATTNVTVLAGNLAGMHHAMAGLSSEQLASGIAAVVEAVSDAVSTRMGVFTFHGDHFLATFNAARPCGGHARKAAEAGLAIAESVPQVGLKLRMRIGIATGTCAIGSVGSERVKTFSTMGAAFTQATVLEHTARKYGCWVVATQRTIADITTHVDHRYIDAVDLPAREGGSKRVLVAELMLRDEAGSSTKDKEWLYVVGDENVGHYAERNKAFELYIAGAVSDARAMLAQMQDGGRYVDVCDGLTQLVDKEVSDPVSKDESSP